MNFAKRGGHASPFKNSNVLSNQLTWRIKMKETRTVTIDPDQYEQLCEYSQRNGQSVKEAFNEALDDYIDSVNTQRSGIERHNRN